MAYLVSRQKVEDYAAWESVFLSRDEQRQAMGQKSYQVLQEAGDPNGLIVLVEFDTLKNARSYASTPGLKEAMVEAGLTEEPLMYIAEEIARSG